MKLLVFLFWVILILFTSFILLSFLFRAIPWNQKVDADVQRTFAFIFSVFITTIFGLVVKDLVTYTWNQDCNPIFGIPTNSDAPFIGTAVCEVALDSTLLVLFAISWLVLHVFLLTLIR